MINRAMRRTLFLVLCLFTDLGYVRVAHGQQVVKQVTEPLMSTVSSDVVSEDDIDYYLTPDGSGLSSPLGDEDLQATSPSMSFWDALVSQMANLGSTDDDFLYSSSPAILTSTTQSTLSDFEWTSASSSTTEVVELTSQDSYNEYDTRFNCDITNFSYVSYSHSIETSWEGCGDTYTVNLTKAVYDRKEIPRIRWLNESSMYKFERLEECTAYNMSIKSDDGNVYKATIRTLPGQVEGLQSVVKNHTISLSWTPSSNKNCDTFQVRLNNKIQSQSKANTFNASYDQTRCTNINVALVDANNNTGNMVTRAVPGSVRNLEATFDTNHIDITWNAPEDSSCVDGYYVLINQQQSNLITTTNYSARNLEACSEYTVGVVAVSNSDNVGELEEKRGTTKTPIAVGTIRNLRVAFSDGILTLTWLPPLLQTECITLYGVITWDQEGTTYDVEVPTTTYSFNSVNWCMVYNIMVKAKINVYEGPNLNTEYTMPQKETNPPTLSSLQSSNTSSTIGLRLDPRTTNMCTITAIVLNCTANEDNPPPWVVQEKSVKQPHADSASRQATVVLEDLSAFTNYKCYAYVENQAGTSNASEPIEFRTSEDVPSEPLNLRYQEDEDGILVTWEKPYMIPGNQGSYAVTLYLEKALHYVPEECDVSVNDVVGQTADLQYRFSQILPNYAYTVYVGATTDAGLGKLASLWVETLPRKSGPPRNVTMVIDNELPENYNATLLATWQLPCDINGELRYFLWELEGISKEDESTDKRSQTIQPDLENDAYGLIIPNLKPAFNYTITIVAYTGEEGLRGEAYTNQFDSPDGYPSAPENLVVKVVSSTSAEIMWDEPLVKNGQIRSYRISIHTTGPRHYIPEDCTLEYSKEYHRELDSDTLFYEFDIGLPNFYYTLSVSAETNAGYGAARDGEFITLSEEPEPPRNISIEINNMLGETYVAFVSISWLLPCNTNGNLAYFLWELLETPFEGTENEPLYAQVEPNEPIANETYELGFSNLGARSKCSFSLIAVVDDGEISGERIIRNFTMPDGYSSPPTNVRIENLTSTSGVLRWGEPLNKNGLIQSYRINGIIHGPMHLIPEDCIIDDGEPFNNTVDADTFSEELDIRPNFKYTASVGAATDAGYKYEEQVEFIALSSESEPPRDVKFTESNDLGEIYNVSCALQWFTPCNSNGILKHFLLAVTRTSVEDPSDTFTQRETIEFDREETYYYTILRDLLPLNTYELTLTPVAEVTEDNDTEIFGQSYTIKYDSPDGWPSAPLNLRVENIEPESGSILWEEPEIKNGMIVNYSLIVKTNGPNYTIPDGCSINYESVVYNVTVDPTMREYAIQAISNFLYEVEVTAATRVTYGSPRATNFKTTVAPPAILTNVKSVITHQKTEDYISYINISFDRPCALNDNFRVYAVNIVGKRHNFEDDKHTFDIMDYKSNYFSLDLQPEFSYSGEIRVLTGSAQSITIIDNFTAAAGVPSRSTRTLETSMLTPTTATIEFDDELFNRNHGDILYYAIIMNVGSQMSDELSESYDFWDRMAWPNLGYWSDNASNEEYQTTPEYWNPFDENTRTVNYSYVIGNGNCTANSTDYCNGPLKPEMNYRVRIRGFTATAYRDTASISFVTPSDWSYLPLLLGLLLGLLAALVLLFFIFILWRRRRKKEVDNTETVVVVDEMKPPPIPKNKFAEHCIMFEENRNQLKAEYSHLERLSSADKPSSNIAMADNNKKKNRYINIMAYDDTRVKLETDSNDNYEDYINASYIKGYSGRAEYIATQGPMESTLEDFWRMIMQEDVGIIVMVAQCVEQSKQKCYKYFPDNEEIVTVGKDIHVKCTSEANLKDYITRTLIVERDGVQKIVKHLQYMLWPDFGCPTNTISMLEFRDMMRKNVENTKNKAVVHCSAGVGRTGTLIAIDILFQKIDNSNEAVDVFGTVLDLRRQRTHMVQTEKQYEYIHKCIRDYLQKPTPTSEDDDEPIYENVNIINGYANMKVAIGQSSTENLIRLKEL